MPTDPLTGSRYPDSTSTTNVPQDIKNAVTDLSDNTIPRFATTTARDTAYSAWVSAGGTMVSGLFCTVAGMKQEYDGTAWGAPLLYGIRMARSTVTAVTNNSAENQGFTSGNVVADRGGYYNGVGADILKVPTGLGGLHLVSLNATMNAVIAARFIAILSDGTAGNEIFRANGAYNDTAQGSATVWLNAGATLGVKIFHQFGSSVNNIGLSVNVHLIGR